MTVIAWDGQVLAADKQMSTVGFCTTVTKIFRVPGIDGEYLVGLAGSAGLAMCVMAWVRDGRVCKDFPKADRNDESVHVLCITPQGKIDLYQNSGHPIRIEDPTFAMGAGQDFAAAALYMGADAKHAVQVACALSCDCGGGIDCLPYRPIREAPAVHASPCY
jgi:ATP-dependent protease HslVU (ClpYQ) peptidase subunit